MPQPQITKPEESREQLISHVRFDPRNIEECQREERREEESKSITRQLKCCTENGKRIIKSPSFWVSMSFFTSLSMMINCCYSLLKKHNVIEDRINEKELQKDQSDFRVDDLIILGAFALLYALSATTLMTIPRSELFWIRGRSSSSTRSIEEGHEYIPLRNLGVETGDQNVRTHSNEVTTVINNGCNINVNTRSTKKNQPPSDLVAEAGLTSSVRFTKENQERKNLAAAVEIGAQSVYTRCNEAVAGGCSKTTAHRHRHRHSAKKNQDIALREDVIVEIDSQTECVSTHKFHCSKGCSFKGLGIL